MSQQAHYDPLTGQFIQGTNASDSVFLNEAFGVYADFRQGHRARDFLTAIKSSYSTIFLGDAVFSVYTGIGNNLNISGDSIINLGECVGTNISENLTSQASVDIYGADFSSTNLFIDSAHSYTAEWNEKGALVIKTYAAEGEELGQMTFHNLNADTANSFEIPHVYGNVYCQSNGDENLIPELEPPDPTPSYNFCDEDANGDTPSQETLTFDEEILIDSPPISPQLDDLRADDTEIFMPTRNTATATSSVKVDPTQTADPVAPLVS